MSIQAIAAAFRVDLPASQKWLLVALGDAATPDGNNCYPSITTLALKTGMTERTVQRNLRVLQQSGMIALGKPHQVRPGVIIPTWRLVFMIDAGLADAPPPPRPNYKPVSKALRRSTIAAFEQVCQYCSKAGDTEIGPDGERWHIDRIVPGSRGGDYTPDNVTLACATCNRRKGAKLLPPDQAPPRSMQLFTETTGAKMAPDQGAIGDTTRVPLATPAHEERGAKAGAPMAPNPGDPRGPVPTDPGTSAAERRTDQDAERVPRRLTPGEEAKLIRQAAVDRWLELRTKHFGARGHFTDPQAIVGLKRAVDRSLAGGCTMSDIAAGLLDHGDDPKGNPWYADEWANRARAIREERQAEDYKRQDRKAADLQRQQADEAMWQGLETKYPGKSRGQIAQLEHQARMRDRGPRPIGEVIASHSTRAS